MFTRIVIAAAVVVCSTVALFSKPVTRQPPITNIGEARRFWSFQPAKDEPLPKVKRIDWVKSSIDALVLAKLEEKGLAPSHPADKRTLIRRATYDLTGLPPTTQEVDAFLADRSPEAFSKVVDRLLASPRYGEHWGRHWLDVARYGDTRWVGAAEDRRYPFAYTYRDWVINAFNRDVPYDRFVTLQLAADQMPGAAPSDQAALGFLTDGKWFTGDIHDVIDDQIDVVTRGFLGLTVQCARCHDHKFDPISTQDYYSLYGLFAASRMPVDGTGLLAELPEIAPPPVDTKTQKEIDVARGQLDRFLLDRQTAVRDEFRPQAKVVEYMLAAESVVSKTDKEVQAFAITRQMNREILQRWVRLLKRTSKGTQPIFGPWHAFAALSEAEFAAKSAGVADDEKAKKPNKNVLPILSPVPTSLAELGVRYAQLFLKFDKAESESDREDEALRQVLHGNESPVLLRIGELEPFLSPADKQNVLAMRRAWLDRLVGLPGNADQFLAYRGEAAPVLEDVRAFLENRRQTLPAEFRSAEKIADYLFVAQQSWDADELRLKSIAKGPKLSERMLQRWIVKLKRCADQNDAVFSAWRAFAAIGEKEFTDKAPAVAADLRKSPGNRHVAEAFATVPASLRDVAARYAAIIVKFDVPAPFGDPEAEAIRQLSAGPRSLTHVAREEVEDFYIQKDQDELKQNDRKLAGLYLEQAGTPAQAMALREMPRGYTQRVFVRGNPNVLGADAHGKFLTVLRAENSERFHEGKGRLELAGKIVDPANPLTARVMVNRVWLEHFGAGLIRTPSDFGIRGDRPSHPELLDSLARAFIADGWSMKKLHRRIMLSATYQQSSDDNTACRQVDPENRLLWRMNRRRLAFEEIRDSLLTAGGRLDETMGGRPDDLEKAGALRRTVYGMIDRISLPGFYRAFDFPCPSAHIAERHETVIPQQALFMMNNGFVIDQALHLAHRAEVGAADSDRGKIVALYRVVFERMPSEEELSTGLEFVRSNADTEKSPARLAGPTEWQYGFGMFSEKENRIVNFEPLPCFEKNSWRGGPQDNDPFLGRCSLNSRGGVAGNDRTRSAIRRWIAPRDGKISIAATLSVQPNSLQPNGEGIRARIVSSRLGPLGVWIENGTEEPTNLADVEVKRGDAIDFLAESRGGQEVFASFSWAPVVKMEDAAGEPSAMKPKLIWDAAKDFKGSSSEPQQLGTWERFAQVLLESNEFLFLD